MGEPQTLLDLVRRRAAETPERIVYTCLEDVGEGVRDLTFGELDLAARGLAVRLSSICPPGSRVLLVLPAGADFIRWFLGCLYAGLIAVPTAAPAKPRDVQRLLGIFEDAEPSCVVGSPEVLGAVASLGLDVHGLAYTDAGTSPEAWRDPSVDGGSVALLQYTSGSTGTPKGVVVRHGNVVANEAMIAGAFEHDASTVVVGWLPPFHDMGLIGNIIQPLFLGARCVMMSPAAFIRDPLRWLRTIAKYRGTTAGGPNFAYEYCLRRHARLERPLDLDLSSWSLAFVGAEPVRAATMHQFGRIFRPYGFDPGALYPCYGLAEATLLVTGGKKGTGVRTSSFGRPGSSTFVGCGTAAEGLDVLVVNPSTGVPCPDGIEGELFVRGSSVSSGYWNRSEESELTMGQTVSGRHGRYLRTGDLAIRHEGEFYVTGRTRDLIIVRGRNIYPQDIEAAAETADGVRAGQAAAFSFEHDGEERVGLAIEVTTESQVGPLLHERIRAAVADAQDVRVDVILLLAPRSLPKTTSNKVERQTVRGAFLGGTLLCVGASNLLAGPGPWSNVIERCHCAKGEAARA